MNIIIALLIYLQGWITSSINHIYSWIYKIIFVTLAMPSQLCGAILLLSGK